MAWHVLQRRTRCRLVCDLQRRFLEHRDARRVRDRSSERYLRTGHDLEGTARDSIGPVGWRVHSKLVLEPTRTARTASWSLHRCKIHGATPAGVRSSLGRFAQRFTGFFTILPPNGPNLLERHAESNAMPTASSRHTGGVNVAMCDGRFDSSPSRSTVAIFSISFHNHCETPYLRRSIAVGVWGAMGSANGGENHNSQRLIVV